MKKQLFFVLVLAFLASSNYILAQPLATKGSDPRAISCTTGPFSPIAGVPYDYSADVAPLGGNAYWYATTSTTFMTNYVRVATEELVGGTYVQAATNYMTPAAVSTNPTTTNITWTSQGIANATVGVADPPELFVVVEYENADPNCANNMKVYPIRPINAFTVDITNIEDATSTPLAYDEAEDQCTDGVVSAEWIASPAPDGSIDYDFGIDDLFFEVVAANFTDSYTPSFSLAGLTGDQTADIDWGYVIGTYDHNVVTGAIVGAGPWTDDEDVVVDGSVVNTSLGVSIYVRVRVHNNDTELPNTGNTITLAVDAVNSANQPDVLHTDCTENLPFADLASQTVNPRPAVTPVTPGVFLPVAP